VTTDATLAAGAVDREDPDAGTADLLRRTAELAIAYRGSLASRRVAPAVGQDALHARLGGPLPEHGESAEAVVELLAREVPDGLIGMPGPRFFGFVLGGGLPAAVAADWLTSVWDQNSPSGLITPAPAVVERVAGDWLIELFGLPAGSSVGFTTGATMANFTGVAVGRHAALGRAGWDVERQGLQGGAPTLTVVAGEDAHVTLFHAIRMLGLGSGRVRRVSAAEQGRMRADALRETLAGVDGPAIVCLQAGNVNSGAFDPLAECVAIVRERLPDAWIHVDGAFGLWATVSPSLRALAAGIDGADSWSTDAHKWLNVPFDTGLVFVRDPAAHRAAMAVTESYLFFDEQHRDPGDYVPELSRRARGFPVYAALRSLGRDGVVDLEERCCRYARRFADSLRDERGIAILNDVVLNQVLVRFDDSDERTRDVIARLQADGTAWFGGGTWHGQQVMRISVINWWTREPDVDRSLDAIRRSLAASRAAG
jgi:glutamate/tyrosine decarboxylase-like PLP-dependent enzyme